MTPTAHLLTGMRRLACAACIAACSTPSVAAAAAPGVVVPVARVLQTPADFHGRPLTLSGYLRPHVLYLFPDRELAEARAWESSLVVGDDPSASIRASSCPGQLVEITGTVRRLDPGIFGVTDIRLITRTDTGAVCWRAAH